MNHPDNSGPCKCSWESYRERITYQGYRSQYATLPAVAIQRAIRKLGLSAIPQYRHGPILHQNSELIPIKSHE